MKLSFVFHLKNKYYNFIYIFNEFIPIGNAIYNNRYDGTK